VVRSVMLINYGNLGNLVIVSAEWTRRPGFDPRQVTGFSLCHCIQIGSGAHPTDMPLLFSVSRIKLAEA